MTTLISLVWYKSQDLQQADLRFMNYVGITNASNIVGMPSPRLTCTLMGNLDNRQCEVYTVDV